jgi:hypothetical protein
MAMLEYIVAGLHRPETIMLKQLLTVVQPSGSMPGLIRRTQ